MSQGQTTEEINIIVEESEHNDRQNSNNNYKKQNNRNTMEQLKMSSIMNSIQQLQNQLEILQDEKQELIEQHKELFNEKRLNDELNKPSDEELQLYSKIRNLNSLIKLLRDRQKELGAFLDAFRQKVGHKYGLIPSNFFSAQMDALQRYIEQNRLTRKEEEILKKDKLGLLKQHESQFDDFKVKFMEYQLISVKLNEILNNRRHLEKEKETLQSERPTVEMSETNSEELSRLSKQIEAKKDEISRLKGRITDLRKQLNALKKGAA